MTEATMDAKAYLVKLKEDSGGRVSKIIVHQMT